MKKIGAKREIPNDIAFPARTGHDACEPFGSRAAIGNEPFGSRAAIGNEPFGSRAAIGNEPFGSRANLRPSVAAELRSGCWRRPKSRSGFDAYRKQPKLPPVVLN